jgi:hypothetical protein
MTIGWIFPISAGGELKGFNDGAMDTFKGDRAASIVRETIQNSLDVRDNKQKPVIVAFTFDSVPAKDIKEIKELSDSLTRSRMQELSLHGAESSSASFYDSALQLVKSQKIEIMGIHDFNTSGLTGPTIAEKNTKPGGWLALVKGAGLSVKSQADSGGSFGHGSKAPIAVSQLRTVFYFSEISKGKTTELRFQGKSILQSHFNKFDEQTQGTGYFGFATEDATPLIDSDVPSWPSRLRSKVDTGCGTSIYVPFADLHKEEKEVWREMKLAVIANFYYAILSGALVVRLGDGTQIDSINVSSELKSLLLLIESGAIKKIDSDGILGGLESSKTILTPSDQGEFNSKEFGSIKWFLRMGDSVESKAVGLSRNGMLITRNAPRLKANSFTGSKPFDIFVSIEGIGSSILKSIENPEHNNIQFDRIDDLTEKRDKERKYESFVKELKELISEFASQDAEEEVSISDLDDLFGGNNFDNSLAAKGVTVTQLVVGKPKQSKIKEGADTEIPDPDSIQSGRGVIGGSGKTKTKGGNIPDSEGDKDIDGVKQTGKQVRDFRVIRQSPTKNVISIYFTPVSKGEYELFIYRSGETEKEPITLREIGVTEWTSSLHLKAVGEKSRVFLEVEIHPSDFGYALEGVMTSGNKA